MASSASGFAALAMALSIVACTPESSAQEVVNGVIESMQETKTYQFSLDVTMDMAAEAESFEMTMVTDLNGVLDFENEKMKVDTNTSMAMSEEDEVEMDMETYIIGHMLYMHGEVPGVGPMWVKSEIPDGIWEQVNQVETMIELLEATQVEVTGTEWIGRASCYVLEITPDMEQVWQLVIQQAEMVGEMPVFSEEMLLSFSVKQWVEKETYLLKQARIEAAMELTPESMGFSEEDGVMNINVIMDLQVYNYNQSVSIELPPEAEGAIEVSLQY